MALIIRGFFVLIFITISLYSYSQNKAIDSLSAVLENHSLDDTTKVKLLNELAVKYIRPDIEKALTLTDKSLKLSKQLEYKLGIAKSNLTKGWIYKVKSVYDTANIYTFKALSQFEELESKIYISKSYSVLGTINNNQGYFKKALFYYNENLKLEIDLDNKMKIAKAYRSIANIYTVQEKFDSSLIYYDKALIIYEKEDYQSGLAEIYTGLGAYHTRKSEYYESLLLFKKAHVIYEKLKDKNKIRTGLYNIGVVYFYQKDFEKALMYYEKALLINEDLKDDRFKASTMASMSVCYKHGDENAIKILKESIIISKKLNRRATLANSLLNLGSHVYETEDKDSALIYFKESLLLHQEMDIKDGIAFNYTNIGTYYFDKNDINKAFNYAKKALQISKEAKFPVLDKDIYILLAKIYESKNDYKNALKYQKKIKIVSDTLFNEENIQKLASIEYEYKYKQQLNSAKIKEENLINEITVSNLNVEKNKQIMLYAIIGFMLIALTLSYVLFKQRIKNIKSENQQAITEQKLLRSQMTPHFIFNSLSVLQGIILNKEYKKSIIFLSKFSKLLRANLENSYSKTVSLEDELEALKNYVAIQNLSLEIPFVYNVFTSENLEPNKIIIPTMIIQPFIENAILHGIKENQNDFKLEININQKNDILSCIITDNGIGVDAHKSKNLNKKESLSTKITSKRLEIISRDFSSQAELKIEDRSNSNENGTIVSLQLPYKTKLEC